MQISRTAKQGLATAVLGVVAPLGLFVWSTMAYRSVHQPILLVPGRVQQDFNVNFNATYVIGIEAERKLPSPTLDRLLGVADFEPKGSCSYTPSVLSVSWILKSDGTLINTSSYAKTPVGAWSKNSIKADLAWFKGQRGKQYTLDLDIAQDGTQLAVTKPMLDVEVDNWDYQDILFPWSIGSVAFAICLVYVGGKKYLVATKGSQKLPAT
jgi:hypothetical protein